MTDESKSRGPIPASIWLLLLAWLGVTVVAVFWGIPHMEAHLAGRGQAALGDLPVGVAFAGRDARLTGSATDSSQVDRAAAAVRGLRGVRRVVADDVAIIPEPSAAPVEMFPPEVMLVFDGGIVTVSGTVPDQATADAIREAAMARWGQESVVDRIAVVRNTSGAAWLAGIVTAISGLNDLSEGSISVGPAGILVVGNVPTAKTITDVHESLSAAFGLEVPVENRLEVVALAEPSFVAELLADGTVSLGGVMPDQPSIDAIVAGAGGVHGSAAVTNEIEVGSAVASPSYLRSLPAIFGAIEGLSPWRFAVAAGRAEITGQAISEEALAETGNRLEIIFAAAGLAVDIKAEVDSTAVAAVLTDLLQGTATFRVGSAQLSADAAALLDEAIEILTDNSTTVLTVAGHTDDVGGDNDNLALSEARAQAVVDYLVAGGIDAARLTAVGYGESRPIAGNDTAEGRSRNRRIEFVVEEGDN